MGLWLRELADSFGVTPFTLINWEKEKTQPGHEILPKIDAYLGYCVAVPATSRHERCRCTRMHILGLSQKECALNLGIDPCTLSTYENGLKVSASMDRRIYDGVRRLADLF